MYISIQVLSYSLSIPFGKGRPAEEIRMNGKGVKGVLKAAGSRRTAGARSPAGRRQPKVQAKSLSLALDLP